jgi:hypothetical protein
LCFFCVSIISVEIKETCPVAKTGRDHKGSGKISTSEKYALPYLNPILKGRQNEHLCG